MSTLILDTNIFIVYLSGLINPNRIEDYARSYTYNQSDFIYIQSQVKKYHDLIICPNIMTEVDNLLNRLRGNDKYLYSLLVEEILKKSQEIYIESLKGISADTFTDIGLTDSIILQMAQNTDLLISADSRLCDHAKARGISVLDFNKYKNDQIFAC